MLTGWYEGSYVNVMLTCLGWYEGSYVNVMLTGLYEGSYVHVMLTGRYEGSYVDGRSSDLLYVCWTHCRSRQRFD